MTPESIARAIDRAVAVLGDLAQREVPLAPLSTYRVGGAARVFVRVDRPDQLNLVHRALEHSALPVIVVGRGSNLLVADAGFNGVAVTFSDSFAEIEVSGTEVRHWPQP